ncbi:hypothetical protein TNCV_935981 [Trichonephila clavipes]|nr:hypothetical protein TNCV_935981 [Trichonephila clavipes]
MFIYQNFEDCTSLVVRSVIRNKIMDCWCRFCSRAVAASSRWLLRRARAPYHQRPAVGTLNCRERTSGVVAEAVHVT